MVAATSFQTIGSRMFMKNYDVDPGTASEAIAAPDGTTTPWYIDASLFAAVGVAVRPTIITTSITRVKLQISDDIAGATNAVVVKDSGAVVADSLNDTIFLEATQEELQAASATGRYVTVLITHTTSTDESNLTLIGWQPKFPRDGLTATVIT